MLSIRAKIVLLYAMGTTLVIASLIVFTMAEVDKHYTGLFLQRGETAANELAGRAEKLIQLGLQVEEFLGFEQQCLEIVNSSPGINYAALIDKSGRILHQSGVHPGVDFTSSKTVPEAGIGSLLIKQSLNYASYELGSSVLIAVDQSTINLEVNRLLKDIVVAGFVLTVLGMLVMVVFIKVNFGIPVESLLQHIRSTRPDRARALPPELTARSDEIGTVATAFDALAHKVEASQQDLLNHASVLEMKVQARTRDLRVANHELERLAHTDMLTELPNRLSFMNMLHHSYAQTLRHGHTLAVFVLDLNGFKQINDQFGHAAGDFVLKTISHKISKSIRQGDTFSRLGGDEFALLVEEYVDDGDLIKIAKKIYDLICAPFTWKGQKFSVTASIGIATFNRETEHHVEGLLGAADTAMYESKRQGNVYAFAEPIVLLE
ncbi:MAG: diguanylate cyclase [Candidatus Thiodiazotropha sp. DIVDIV]